MVRCKQPAVPADAPAPKAHQWVTFTPPKPGEQQGAARLSEQAVKWIVGILSSNRKLRGLRKVEHECLDEAEAKKLITQ